VNEVWDKYHENMKGLDEGEKEKLSSFLHPRQRHQKYVVPEIDSKTQIIMSSIKVLNEMFLRVIFYTFSFSKIMFK
jgi:hypothetical protein